jgi:hypothetical protein
LPFVVVGVTGTLVTTGTVTEAEGAVEDVLVDVDATDEVVVELLVVAAVVAGLLTDVMVVDVGLPVVDAGTVDDATAVEPVTGTVLTPGTVVGGPMGVRTVTVTTMEAGGTT